MMKLLKISSLALLTLAACFSQSCGGRDVFEALNKQAAEEYLVPIRPASEGRNPCWNGYSRKFTFAPAFEVEAKEGAASYEFIITPQPSSYYPEGVSADSKWSFVSEDPCADLSPVWASIPPSNVHLDILARDRAGNLIDTVFQRSFLRDFPFRGPYSGNVRSYREAAVMAAMYVHRMKAVQSFRESTEPDMSYDHFTYANKIVGGLISIEAKLAREVPSMREEALQIARNAARFLFDSSRPEGDPLEFFPPTYYGGYVTSGAEWNQGKTMTMDALMAANAFLDLFDVTGDSLYLDRSLRIAHTYSTLQGEDGSFPMKVDFATGEPVNAAKAMLTPLLNFIRRLERNYGITEYSEMREKASSWMREVALETFDLTGQFEDVNIMGLVRYQNLTNCTACPYASYLLTGEDVTKQDIADAADLIHMSEDQFVHWDYLPDENGIRIMPTPCVFEQHLFQQAVDNSSCNVANAFLDYYNATGDRLAFEKAKALADNLTIVQNATTGRIPTIMQFRPTGNGNSFWINCSNASITLLLRMAEITGETVAQR